MKEKLKFVHKKKEKQTENGLTERLSVRLARFILRRQKWIESIFVAGCVFSFIAMLFVNVNYDLTEYLPRAKGVNAIGLTGADMNVICSVKRPVKDVDYGFVGSQTLPARTCCSK